MSPARRASSFSGGERSTGILPVGQVGVSPASLLCELNNRLEARWPHRQDARATTPAASFPNSVWERHCPGSSASSVEKRFALSAQVSAVSFIVYPPALPTS